MTKRQREIILGLGKNLRELTFKLSDCAHKGDESGVRKAAADMESEMTALHGAIQSE